MRLGEHAIHGAVFLGRGPHGHRNEPGYRREAQRLEQRVEPVHHVQIPMERHGVSER